MSPQERVNLIAGLQSKQPPQVGFREVAVPVFVRGQGYQRTAGQIATGRAQALRYVTCRLTRPPPRLYTL